MQTKDFIFYERRKMTTQFLIKELDRAFKDYLKNEDIEIYESKLKIIKENYQLSQSNGRVEKS